jgi:hypothetical protein
MKTRTFENSPNWYARIAGMFYLLVIFLGIFAEGFVVNQFVVSGDQAKTAQNILANRSLWNLGVMANICLILCAITVSWLLYNLLKPVNKNLILLAALFNVVSLAIESVSKMCLLLVLPILKNVQYSKAFTPEQVHAFANIALKSHEIAFNFALILFGVTIIIYGVLIYKSGYLPKMIGVLMQIGGVSYLIACFSIFFAPVISNLINPYILIPCIVGEGSLCLWLLIKGVNLVKWNEKIAPST